MLPSEPILPPKPKPSTRKVSYPRENAPPLPSTYAATLQNHQLNQRELGTLEAHRARHNARTNLFHGDNKDLAREAWKDLRLHGQSLTFRKVTPFSQAKSSSNNSGDSAPKRTLTLTPNHTPNLTPTVSGARDCLSLAYVS